MHEMSLFLFVVGLVIHSGSALTCQRCTNIALSDPTGTGETWLALISGRNPYTDDGCEEWGTDYPETETCTPDTVRLGKDLTSGSEGVTFRYTCAALNLLMDLVIPFPDSQGQPDTTLRAQGALRACVAVPVPDNSTRDACYDVPSSEYIIKYEGDLDLPLDLLKERKFVDDGGLSNVGCLCSTDSCNHQMPDSRDNVVTGPSTTPAPTTTTAPATTETTILTTSAPTKGSKVNAAEGFASSMFLIISGVLMLFVVV